MISKKVNLFLKKNLKKLFVLFLLSYSIFLFKNVTRISDELKLADHSHHNFKNFPFFWVEKTFQEKILVNKFILQKAKGKCWATPSTCIRSSDNLKIISKNGYIFYLNKNENEK